MWILLHFSQHAKTEWNKFLTEVKAVEGNNYRVELLFNTVTEFNCSSVKKQSYGRRHMVMHVIFRSKIFKKLGKLPELNKITLTKITRTGM